MPEYYFKSGQTSYPHLPALFLFFFPSCPATEETVVKLMDASKSDNTSFHFLNT